MNFNNVELPSNRKFGFFFTAIFTAIGFYFTSKELVILGSFLLAIAFLFLVITLVKANLLLSLNKLWMNLGLLLGIVVSPIVLGVIFFGLFTPFGFLMKLFGRDELSIKFKARDSYWKERNTGPLRADAFKNQF